MSFLRPTARPLVFAHRGGCALGPENTIAAFDRGLAAGADGFELDVHLSADGIVVVCHDDTLERTTGAVGPVRARTAAELARVDAGHRFVDAAGGFPFRGRGIGVPTLRDVLERYPRHAAHRRDESGHARTGARGGRGRACRRRRRARLRGRIRSAVARHRPVDASRAGDERQLSGSPMGPLSLDRPMARAPRALRRVPGSGVGGAAPHHFAAIRPPRARRRSAPSGRGRSTTKRTCSGYCDGASTG